MQLKILLSAKLKIQFIRGNNKNVPFFICREKNTAFCSFFVDLMDKPLVELNNIVANNI